MNERNLRDRQIMVISHRDKWVMNNICQAYSGLWTLWMWTHVYGCDKTDFISHCAGLWKPGKRGFADRTLDLKEACVLKLLSWTEEDT